MSDEQKNAESQVAPGDVLFAKVYVPEFLKAAAAGGVSPRSEDELMEMLKIAAKLRQVAEQSEQPVGVIKQASDSLSSMLGQADEGSAYLQDAEVKEALAALSV